MLAIRAERESQKVALMGVIAKARVWKICNLIGRKIQHRDRLMSEGLLRPVSVV